MICIFYLFIYLFFDLYILTEFFLNKKADLTQGDGWGDRGAPGFGQHWPGGAEKHSGCSISKNAWVRDSKNAILGMPNIPVVSDLQSRWQLQDSDSRCNWYALDLAVTKA